MLFGCVKVNSYYTCQCHHSDFYLLQKVTGVNRSPAFVAVLKTPVGQVACQSSYLTNRVRLFFPIRARTRGYVQFKMSAVCVYPMCFRLSRGLLRLRSDASASTAAGLIRKLSVGLGKGKESGATEGLAQAILQERLQQQGTQVSQLFSTVISILLYHVLPFILGYPAMNKTLQVYYCRKEKNVLIIYCKVFCFIVNVVPVISLNGLKLLRRSLALT